MLIIDKPLFVLIVKSEDGRFWDFTSDLAKGDTAYTTLALGAHTDNTYYVCVASMNSSRKFSLLLSRRTLLGFSCFIFYRIPMEVEAPRYLWMDSMLHLF